MHDRSFPPFTGMILLVASGAAACDGSATGSGGAGGSAAGSGGATSTATAGSGGSAGAPAQPFQPAGCEFTVAPRPEYTDWSTGKNDVGPSPDIRRVRLGLGGNVAVGAKGRADPSTSIGFAWQTDDGTLASEVQWGASLDPSSWSAENRAAGVTWRTPAGLINGSGDQRMHEAYLCGLTPATTYYYRVGGGPSGEEAWSDVYSFTTTPSDPSAKVTLAVAGDARGQDNDAWRLLQKRVTLAGATMQLFSGDVVNLPPDQGEWEKWLDLAWKDESGKLSTLGQILTVSAHGNHENHSTLFFGNMVLPQDIAAYPEYAELFYSFDVGPAHIIVMDDAFIVSPAGDAAFKGIFTPWLEADLDAATKNRAKVPWIIAMHHHGEFSSSDHAMDADVLRGREYYVPIWDKYHVDLDVAGHDHNYERSKPLTGPASNPTIHGDFKDGTAYLICAGAGADAHAAGTSAFTAVSKDYKTGGAIGSYGIVHISQSELTFEGRELRADASDPLIDTFTIKK
jgi:acid phosphatase type 7